RAESALKKQFQFRLTHKIYYARVWGHVEQEEGEIDLPLICDWPNRPLQKVCFEDGKPSNTHFQVAKREEHEGGTKTTIVRLLPITG
uniref:pseudouridine synthase n=1 Tax=Vibrio cholerae TaxID=666 RepID=UPI00301D03CF